LTGVTSYYVRADGSDANAGTSETAPFKTLAKAVEEAAKTQVKKITVIGTLAGNTQIEKTDPTENIPKKYMDATGGQDIAEVLDARIGVATIDWSLDERDPDEILITGKPDASGAERAVLTPEDHDKPILTILSSTVRLEHIEISGQKSVKSALFAIAVSGTLTLAQGARITKNIGGGIWGHLGVVIMRDDAEVSYNEGRDNVGVYLERGSVMVMFDKSRVTGNKAANNGGGVAMEGSSLLMYGSSSISGNSAGNGGGGIITFTDTKNGYISQITMSGNGVIQGNTAKIGGGILLQDRLIMNDKTQIIENTATEIGGGVFGATDNAAVTKGEDAVIANNIAPEIPDINFKFN
jgi:hypothetical protein